MKFKAKDLVMVYNEFPLYIGTILSLRKHRYNRYEIKVIKTFNWAYTVGVIRQPSDKYVRLLTQEEQLEYL